MKSWQRFWGNEQSGRYSYNLIPSVKNKVLFPCNRDTEISYCRLLLHNSMLKDDSYRSGISLTPECDCGISRETSEHYLIYCNIHKKDRDELFEQVREIAACKKNNGSEILSEQLLLAPFSDHISKSNNRIIKDLFRCVSTTKRSL